MSGIRLPTILVALALAVLAVGGWYPWMRVVEESLHPMVGLEGTVGVYPLRFALLLPGATVLVLDLLDRLPRTRIALATATALAAIWYPAYRVALLNSGSTVVSPHLGLYVTALGGAIMLVAVTLAVVERSTGRAFEYRALARRE